MRSGHIDCVSRMRPFVCGCQVEELSFALNIFMTVIFFWQWGRKLVKPGAEPTVFSFAPAVSRQEAPAEWQSHDGTSSCSSEKSEEAGHASSQQEAMPGPGPDISSSASDHSYAVGSSPRILASHMQTLVKRLHDRISALRNARKRERRLRGKVGDLLQRLKELQLIHSKTEELLEIYKKKTFLLIFCLANVGRNLLKIRSSLPLLSTTTALQPTSTSVDVSSFCHVHEPYEAG